MQAKAGCRSLFKEAIWLKDGYIPTLEEYMSNSLVTCGYALMIARSFVGRGEPVTEDSFKWVATNPPIVEASCLILRLMDDIATHKVLCTTRAYFYVFESKLLYAYILTQLTNKCVLGGTRKRACCFMHRIVPKGNRCIRGRSM